VVVPRSIRLLAEAARLAEGEIGERDSSPAIERAVEAAALATRALELDPSLPAAHLVGQVRATAADLLRALGLERTDAVARLRAERVGDAVLEPADHPGAAAAEHDALLPRLAEDRIEAVDAPDREHVRRVAAADPDDVLLERQLAEAGGRPGEELEMAQLGLP